MKRTPVAYAGDLRIGIHTSTAGALSRSATKAAELKANTFQIFSASPRMWRSKRPDHEQIQLLKRERELCDLTPLVIHDNYLINLAAPPSEIREKSVEAFKSEIERALLIGAEYLVAHPGNYKGLTLEQGLLNVAEALALAWRSLETGLKSKSKLTILFENTAGAGAQLGGKMDELAVIRSLAQPYLDVRIGFCLDTCHSYVSGFDISQEEGLTEFVQVISETLGLENIPVIHTNDTKMKLGSHCDRHSHIGEGNIGLEGFRRILNHPSLSKKAFILETPVDEPGDDLRNVRTLQGLVASSKSTKTSKKRFTRTAVIR